MTRSSLIARTLIGLLATCLILAWPPTSSAQRRGREGIVGVQSPYSGDLRLCRLRFRNTPEGDGDGWFVDYPRAEENLATRVSELTKIPVARDKDGKPAHAVFTLTDPDIFSCPFVMMSEPGGSYFDDEEAAQLRTYLLKGGFLWADDFWGSHAWEWWLEQLHKALPASEFEVVQLPLDHQLYHTLFDITDVPQIPNIGLWIQRGLTSERGSESPHELPHAIVDSHGRVMVFMTHNTDFGDAYEEEAGSPDAFADFSTVPYRIGADLLLYAMTH